MDRGHLAVSAWQVSFTGDLLAALEAVGRARCLARRLADIAWRLGWRRTAAVTSDDSWLLAVSIALPRQGNNPRREPSAADADLCSSPICCMSTIDQREEPLGL